MNRARNSAIFQLTLARLREVWREPAVVFWIFGFPVVMAAVLGLAFRSRPVESFPVALVEGERISWAVDALEESERITASVLPEADADEALRTGRVDVVVVSDGAPGVGEIGFVYRFDPTRPQSQTARLAVDDALQRAAGRTDPGEVREEEVTEPGARYVDFLLPGLIGLNLMGSSMWGIGFAIVVMRTGKLLKRFAATPMKRSDFLLALMLSRLVFLAAEVAVLLLFGWLMFGVEIRGSIVALVLVSLLGASSFAGIAILTVARTKTVEVASGLMNFVMIPMWLCCGSFFSSTRFPEVLHPAIRALPLTAVNDALRAVMNDGAPLSGVWSEALVLVFWGLASFVVALRLFRWQ